MTTRDSKEAKDLSPVALRLCHAKKRGTGRGELGPCEKDRGGEEERTGKIQIPHGVGWKGQRSSGVSNITSWKAGGGKNTFLGRHKGRIRKGGI